MTFTLTGRVYRGNLLGHERTFSAVCLPFSQAWQSVKTFVFRADTGAGEQRAVVDGYVKRLKRAMEAGEYTPTPVTVGLGPEQRASVVYHDESFTLQVKQSDPLHLV